jgi:hypothetical protein
LGIRKTATANTAARKMSIRIRYVVGRVIGDLDR